MWPCKNALSNTLNKSLLSWYYMEGNPRDQAVNLKSPTWRKSPDEANRLDFYAAFLRFWVVSVCKSLKLKLIRVIFLAWLQIKTHPW